MACASQTREAPREIGFRLTLSGLSMKCFTTSMPSYPTCVVSLGWSGRNLGCSVRTRRSLRRVDPPVRSLGRSPVYEPPSDPLPDGEPPKIGSPKARLPGALRTEARRARGNLRDLRGQRQFRSMIPFRVLSKILSVASRKTQDARQKCTIILLETWDLRPVTRELHLCGSCHTPPV
jgi:hypothetical protein